MKLEPLCTKVSGIKKEINNTLKSKGNVLGEELSSLQEKLGTCMTLNIISQKKSRLTYFLNFLRLKKILTKNLLRFEVKESGVAKYLFIPPDTVLALNMLVENRHRYVKKNNRYLFASINSSKGYFRADKPLKKFAITCQAEFPHNLTLTRIRKHVPPMVQLLRLKSHKFEGVAQFMGILKFT